MHVPFCTRRCDYCAFATWTDRHHLMGAYAAACRAELSRAVAEGMPAATSVFFGGGTPSLLPAGELMAVLAAVPTAPGAEVTVECNPETVTGELLQAYADHGVTRLSFGAQSMVASVLASLGRAHDPDAVLRAVDAARQAGFANYNIDLIYGAAAETDRDWQATLDAAIALEPAHVSAYALTVEPGTPLAADPTRHPDDDTQADRYLTADEALVAAGLSNYEISNWARPGRECRHNRLYWSQGDYRGIGCAAHSHQAGRRWWNVRTPERYVALVGQGRSPVAGEERLDGRTRREEAIHLALRTREGVNVAELAGEARAELGSLADQGLVERRGERAVLTRRGRLLANEVAVRLG